MDVISHPFRLAPTGEVATVLDGTEQANAEAIAVLVSTRIGERVLVPGFGISDPVFAEVDEAEVNAGLATYGPPDVNVTAITIDYPTDTAAAIRIDFED